MKISEMRKDLIQRIYEVSVQQAEKTQSEDEKLMVLKESLNAISFSCEKLPAD